MYATSFFVLLASWRTSVTNTSPPAKSSSLQGIDDLLFGKIFLRGINFSEWRFFFSYFREIIFAIIKDWFF